MSIFERSKILNSLLLSFLFLVINQPRSNASQGLDSSVALGICIEKKIKLLASYSNSGDLIPLTLHGKFKEPKFDIDKIRKLTQGKVWYGLSPGGDKKDVGKMSLLNEQSKEIIDVGETVEGSSLYLGNCETYGTIYSTIRLGKLKKKSVEPSASEKLAQRTVGNQFKPEKYGIYPADATPEIEGHQSFVVATNPKYYESLVKLRFKPFGHPWMFWSLIFEDQEMIVQEAGTFDGYLIASVYESYWTIIEGWDGHRIGLIHFREDYDGGGAGERILVVTISPNGKTKSLKTILDYVMGD